MAKYIVTHKYNLGTTFNSSNLRCKGWTSQILTWLGKRILKNVSSPSSPDSKMRVLHILIYPTFNFNTNLPYSVLALIKTIKGFTTRLVWWGILCGLSSLCLGRGHPEIYPTGTAWAVWKLLDCVWYLYPADHLHIHFLPEDLKLRFNKMKTVGEESWNTHRYKA